MSDSKAGRLADNVHRTGTAAFRKRQPIVTSMNIGRTEKESAEYDVLIVGYGPTGASIANLLGKRGYRVAVFDQAGEIYDKPRAITADQEVMRVFQECGLADEIAAATTPHPGTDFLGIDGQVIKRFYPAPPPHPLSWEPTWMFVQPELEATLRRGVARYPQVHEFLRHECLDFTQSGETVSARLRRLDDGAEITMRGRYLIGCDGGRSVVRRAVGARIEDLAFDEWWIVVDAWIRGPVELPPRCAQFCRPWRPGTYMVGPGKLRRWEIKMLPGEKPEDFESSDAVLKVLGSFVDTTHLELCRTAIYRFHALVVEQWRSGRVFLAGDAAHQTPPFLGQGLSAGIRDAINLVWKLDGVERLGYADSLLDTYGEERKPHVRTIVAHAKAFGLIIGELDMQAAQRRDRELGEQLASGKAETVRQKFIPGLDSGLIGRDRDGHRHRGAGELFVQPWVHRGDEPRRFDDLFEPGFLFVAGSKTALGWFDADMMQAWQRLHGQLVLIEPAGFAPAAGAELFVSLQERDGLFRDWLAATGAQAVIVRPDRYVYGAVADAQELRGLLAQLSQAVWPAPG